jgi:hypothetical protein
LHETVNVDFIYWIELVELVQPQGSHQVSVVSLIMKCDLFKNTLGLTIAPERVEFRVFLEDFRDFVSAIKDKPISNTDSKHPELSQLSEEFGFQALSMKLSMHRKSPGLTDVQTAEVVSRISSLKERARQHERQFEELQSALQRVEADLSRLVSSRLRIGSIPRRKDQRRCRPSGSRTAPARSHEATARRSAGRCRPAHRAGRLDSLIVVDFPPLFEEFRVKRFKLPWRGSREGIAHPL